MYRLGWDLLISGPTIQCAESQNGLSALGVMGPGDFLEEEDLTQLS